MTNNWIKLAAQLGGRRPRRLPAVWLVIERSRQPDPMPALLALPAGSGVILRDYGAPDRAAWARQLAQTCRRRRLVFLVGGDPKLAFHLHADGVHWPEALARPLPWGLVSIAAHGPRGLAKAGRIGADMALLSPVFATASHPAAPALGPGRFAALARRAPCPVLALGGVTRNTLPRLRNSGAAGFAAIDGLLP